MSVLKVGFEYLKIDKWPLIFCCTSDTTILNIVSKVAFENKVRVWHNTCSSDIMAVPCDIVVVDRSMLGENAWKDYISWMNEIEKTEETLFVFLDKGPHDDEKFLLNTKSFHKDFNSDYKSLFSFLNAALQRIVKEKCCHE